MNLSTPTLALVSAALIAPQISFAETNANLGFQDWLQVHDKTFKERLQEKYALFLKQKRAQWDRMHVWSPNRETGVWSIQNSSDGGHKADTQREVTRIWYGLTKRRFWGQLRTQDDVSGRQTNGVAPLPGIRTDFPENGETGMVAKADDAIPHAAVRDQAGVTGTPREPVNDEKSTGTPRDLFAEAFVDAINKARSRSRRCGNRIYAAAPSIDWNGRLEAAAAKHSDEMAKYNYFSHTGTDGLSVGDRVAAQGYRWRAVGENIAAGTKTIEATIDTWLQSPGHCANIMNPSFSDIGVARAEDSGTDYGVYWTLVLAGR